MQSAAPTISESLLTLPANWILEPVCGKRPYRKGWTKSNVDRLRCLQDLESGAATGIGLKLGEGLLAIDVDGDGAANLLQKLAGENSLQEFTQTVAWSSGRKGRKQYLFSVPESEWGRLRNLRIGTDAIGEDGKEESLEFRWLGTQSVLPPSVHPLTNKPYYWEKSPCETETIQAPEWLLTLCENWHPEYAGEGELDLIRFPARLYKFFRRSLAIWMLARRSDNSRRIYGKNKGSGIGSFHLSRAASLLNRSEGHIRKLLGKAKKLGLLRDYSQKGDSITCWYTSFERVVAIAGLDDIGPIAAINIDDLSELNILATEVEAQNLQRVSYYSKQQEEGRRNKEEGKDPAKTLTRIIRPSDLLHPCGIPARVLAKGDRFLYCESDFQFYGGSQEGIGQRRGISTSTVGRHLSNRYRLESAPVRGYRAGVSPIVKKQLAERLPLLKGMPAKLCREDGLFFAHSDWFRPHCNVYLLNHRLISCKRRRIQISGKIDNESLLFDAGSPKILDNNNFLYVLPSEELEECLGIGQLLDRNLKSKTQSQNNRDNNNQKRS
ncbi:bifunctional DNA primase/polymerase [Microcoleus sp. A006_D1]|uniref:bifunctional DNA primase/polymerase n=1 Tax=Microcoleus sp. A006_D1 TaxID=3055267 RepID=UPI002FD61FCC